MKIIHTSDIHIGRMLYGRKRYTEFAQFLNWLANTVESEAADALIIAGDVFDTTAPSNQAQELYYNFLAQVARSKHCRNVVVVAGNHDSPSFLGAPQSLLRALNVHVICEPGATPAEQVVVLSNAQNQPALLLCAVPFLRDRDVRTAEASETVEQKESKIVEGIARHYAAVVDAAVQKRAELQINAPIVATGHLFAAGSQTTKDDGVRDLYVGSLGHVHASVFPAALSYVALGHLHVPQAVGGLSHVRYCGSPLAMNFDEAKHAKHVLVVEFPQNSANQPIVRPVDVPVFQNLVSVRGTWEAISQELAALAANNSAAWVEVVYTGEALVGNLSERVQEATQGTNLVVLRTVNARSVQATLTRETTSETLETMDPGLVFERCLEQHGVPAEQRPALRATYQEVLAHIANADTNAQ